jgi:hypothetical protein
MSINLAFCLHYNCSFYEYCVLRLKFENVWVAVQPRALGGFIVRTTDIEA